MNDPLNYVIEIRITSPSGFVAQGTQRVPLEVADAFKLGFKQMLAAKLRRLTDTVIVDCLQ